MQQQQDNKSPTSEIKETPAAQASGGQQELGEVYQTMNARFEDVENNVADLLEWAEKTKAQVKNVLHLNDEKLQPLLDKMTACENVCRQQLQQQVQYEQQMKELESKIASSVSTEVLEAAKKELIALFQQQLAVKVDDSVIQNVRTEMQQLKTTIAQQAISQADMQQQQKQLEEWQKSLDTQQKNHATSMEKLHQAFTQTEQALKTVHVKLENHEQRLNELEKGPKTPVKAIGMSRVFSLFNKVLINQQEQQAKLNDIERAVSPKDKKTPDSPAEVQNKKDKSDQKEMVEPSTPKSPQKSLEQKREEEQKIPPTPVRSPSPKRLNGEEEYRRGIQFEKEKKWEAAFEAYQVSAMQGFFKAYTNIGRFLLGGKGKVPTDKKGASYCFSQAAEQDHLRAMFNLAEMLRCGDGIPKDLNKALFWYNKAAQLGDKDANTEADKLRQKLNQPVKAPQNQR